MGRDRGHSGGARPGPGYWRDDTGAWRPPTDHPDYLALQEEAARIATSATAAEAGDDGLPPTIPPAGTDGEGPIVAAAHHAAYPDDDGGVLSPERRAEIRAEVLRAERDRQRSGRGDRGGWRRRLDE